MTKEQILEKQLRRYILGIKDISHGTDAVPAAIYNSMEEYTTQQVTAEREKWEAEKKEILSAVARGERLSEELRIDGPSLLEQEREKAAKLVNSLEMALQILEENQKERHPFSIRMIRQSLTEYKSVHVNALTNSNESPGSDKE